jgi:enoyl-CoA hydratase
MTPALVLSEEIGPVRVLTMNRPDKRNALSPDLIGTLYAALREADDDASVHAVVLTGADPAFCAGVDLKEAQRLGSVYFKQFQKQSCIRQTGEMRTPIVGAINGAVFTGGLEMALGCDFLIASERAVFADTHARVGILPGGGMTARLPHVVGAAMAREPSASGWSPKSCPTNNCCPEPSSWPARSLRYPRQSWPGSRKSTSPARRRLSIRLSPPNGRSPARRPWIRTA